VDLERVTTMLVREEGEILHAYQDHLGYWTIGVGRLIDRAKGGRISQAESRMLLANDIRRFEMHLKKYPWYEQLDDARKGVLVGMVFQLGTAGFDSFKNTLRAIAERRYADAAQGMLSSLWARQTPARVKRMAEIMRTGIWTY
jgi:lysozyme